MGWKGKETGSEGNFLEWFSLKEMKATVDRGGVGGRAFHFKYGRLEPIVTEY